MKETKQNCIFLNKQDWGISQQGCGVSAIKVCGVSTINTSIQQAKLAPEHKCLHYVLDNYLGETNLL